MKEKKTKTSSVLMAIAGTVQVFRSADLLKEENEAPSTNPKFGKIVKWTAWIGIGVGVAMICTALYNEACTEIDAEKHQKIKIKKKFK